MQRFQRDLQVYVATDLTFTQLLNKNWTCMYGKQLPQNVLNIHSISAFFNFCFHTL